MNFAKTWALNEKKFNILAVHENEILNAKIEIKENSDSHLTMLMQLGLPNQIATSNSNSDAN